MTEVFDDRTGQLTFRQANGPGFFHVGLVDEDVTVGCSTRMSLRSCFATVSGVAVGDPRLREAIEAIDANGAYLTVQEHYPTGPAVYSRRLDLQESRHWIDDLADNLTVGLPGDIAVIRVDIGYSSWQWDDVGSSQWPDARSFGGLASRSLVYSLMDVMAHIGDEWMQEHFEELRPGITRFLEAHAG